jgi:hypothetical protein
MRKRAVVDEGYHIDDNVNVALELNGKPIEIVNIAGSMMLTSMGFNRPGMIMKDKVYYDIPFKFYLEWINDPNFFDKFINKMLMNLSISCDDSNVKLVTLYATVDNKGNILSQEYKELV